MKQTVWHVFHNHWLPKKKNLFIDLIWLWDNSKLFWVKSRTRPRLHYVRRLAHLFALLISNNISSSPRNQAFGWLSRWSLNKRFRKKSIGRMVGGVSQFVKFVETSCLYFECSWRQHERSNQKCSTRKQSWTVRMVICVHTTITSFCFSGVLFWFSCTCGSTGSTLLKRW